MQIKRPVFESNDNVALATFSFRVQRAKFNLNFSV